MARAVFRVKEEYSMNPVEKTKWYKDAVIYEIYPRSFCDSNEIGRASCRERV